MNNHHENLIKQKLSVFAPNAKILSIQYIDTYKTKLFGFGNTKYLADYLVYVSDFTEPSVKEITARIIYNSNCEMRVTKRL